MSKSQAMRGPTTAADKIAYTMKLRGLNRATMVKRYGIKAAFLSRVLAGEVVGYQTIALIGSALELPLSWLFDDSRDLRDMAAGYCRHAETFAIERVQSVPAAIVSCLHERGADSPQRAVTLEVVSEFAGTKPEHVLRFVSSINCSAFAVIVERTGIAPEITTGLWLCISGERLIERAFAADAAGDALKSRAGLYRKTAANMNFDISSAAGRAMKAVALRG